MQFSIELGPGAEKDALARELERRIRANLAQRRGARVFSRLWGTVVIVSKEEARSLSQAELEPAPLSVTPEAPVSTLTLRFDYGRLLIHEGRVGRPDVTLWGTSREILAWGDAAQKTTESFDVRRWTVWSDWFFAGGLRIFGRWSHPRLVWRLLILLGARSPRTSS